MIVARRLAGSWCDVAAGPVLARVVERTVRVEGDLVFTIDEPDAPSLYLRCAVVGRDIAVIVQGQSGAAWLSTNAGPWRHVGPSFGQNAVLACVRDGRLWVAVMRSATSYDLWPLGEDAAPWTVTVPATSQGLLGVAEDGTILLTDAARNGPHGLLLAATAGALTVGQHPTRDALMGVWGGLVFTIADGAAFEPHVVADAPDRWRACARSTHGTCLVADLAAPFPADPVPEPPPEPPPDPEPPPMPTPYADFSWDRCTIHRDAPDIGAWPITSTITHASAIDDRVVVEHSQAGRWPAVRYESITVEGCVWTVAWIDGQWRAATWDRLRPGQTEKEMGATEYQQGYALNAPGWVPQAGEIVGYLVSTPARNDERGPVNQRSAVAWVRYGTDEIVAFETDAPAPDPEPDPDPPPGPPPADDLAALTARVADLERVLRAVRLALRVG